MSVDLKENWIQLHMLSLDTPVTAILVLPAQVVTAEHHKAKSKSQLKTSIRQQHSSNNLTDKFIRAIAFAMVDLGFSSTASNSFRVKPVPFTKVGLEIARLKKQNNLASTPLTAIISKLSLEQYFTWTILNNSEKLLAVNMAELLPQASSTIRGLLPSVSWKVASGRPACLKEAVFPASRDMQSSSSSSSNIEAHHAVPAPSTKQLKLQIPKCPVMPSAAIVLDMGLHQPGNQMQRLIHIVQVKSCL